MAGSDIPATDPSTARAKHNLFMGNKDVGRKALIRGAKPPYRTVRCAPYITNRARARFLGHGQYRRQLDATPLRLPDFHSNFRARRITSQAMLKSFVGSTRNCSHR